MTNPKARRASRVSGILLLILTACSQGPEPTAYRADGSYEWHGTVATTAAPTTQPRPVPIRTMHRASRGRTTQRTNYATGGSVWDALARCESGGNPRAVGGGGRYFGAFQFSLGTWRSLGMAGNPVDYPYAVQLDAAQRLVARSGWGQFPHCSRKLGLR